MRYRGRKGWGGEVVREKAGEREIEIESECECECERKNRRVVTSGLSQTNLKRDWVALSHVAVVDLAMAKMKLADSVGLSIGKRMARQWRK